MATVARLGESGLIRRFAKRLHADASVLVGIGDDAAVLAPALRRDERLVFASDMLVEDVHFTRRLPAVEVGWKALAVNVSDVAAMGGRPRAAVVSLGLPPSTPVAWVDGLYRGLERCARRFSVSIVGGDTVCAPRRIIDVAILGAVTRRHLVRRSGAKVGDRLFVTGHLGGSLAGHHARFTPRLAVAQALVHRHRVHAMMDLSDGLASDAWQLARVSGVRLQIDARRIPVASAARRCRSARCPGAASRDAHARWHALMDGEDFELLFAMAPAQAQRTPRRLVGVPVTEIGRVVSSGAAVELRGVDGRVRPLQPAGFRHF